MTQHQIRQHVPVIPADDQERIRPAEVTTIQQRRLRRCRLREFRAKNLVGSADERALAHLKKLAAGAHLTKEAKAAVERLKE